MKRHSRTALLFTVMLAAPLLASTIASRTRRSDSIPQTIQENERGTSVKADSENRQVPVSTPAHFEALKVQGRKSINELEARLGPDGFSAMLKINRTDRRHIRAGDSLVIPDASTDLLSLAPFPKELQGARTIPKLVLVSRRVQAFAAYESGKLVRWGPTSTGKKTTPTPAGLFHTNWKAKETRSSVNQSWVLPWCFNLDNFAGVSFHKFDLPGYPASHGCVRLLEEDAHWMYDWADQWTLSKTDDSIIAFGTPVVIFGDYKYGESPLWKRLGDDPGAATVSLAESESVLSQHLPMIEAKARVGRSGAKDTEVAKADVAALPD